MKFPKVIAYPAPKPLKPYAPILGKALAVMLTVLTLLQLIGAASTIGSLSTQLDENNGLAVTIFVFAIVSQVFAIPFLLRLKISDLARLIGGILTVVSAWIWTMVLVWSVGTDTSAAQFGFFSAISNAWWLLLANSLWLLVSLFVAKQLGLELTWKKLGKAVKSQLKKKQN